MSEKPGVESESPIRALYIDDDQGLLDLTRDFLERRTPQIRVETSSLPHRGLALLENRDFDVVVCDYQMPEMDGLEVLETVREEHEDDVPFIMFTGRGREEVAIEALNLGADRYLQKGGDPTSQYGVLAQAIEQEVEHFRTQRQLQEREENLELVLESIGDAVITTDVEGRVTRLNSVAEVLTGWDTAEAVGEPLPRVFEIINQETREPETDPAQKVLENGKTVGLANGTILVRKDGSERYIADSASPIAKGDGEILGVVVVFRDVTEDYRSRTRQKRQRQAIIDLSVDGDITEGNLDRGTRTITETAAETLGVDRVSIWLFEDDTTVLRNVDMYEEPTDSHVSGDELVADELPDYFEALRTHRAIPAEDAQRDPRTAELHEEYLEPLGIASMLDATVRSGGDVVGVVCHEHKGSPREWTDDELRFAGEIADQVLRLLNNRKQREHKEALRELHSIARDITTFDAPEVVCQRTIDVAETLLDFDQCVINLEEDGRLPIVAVSKGMPPDGVTPMSVDEGIAGKTYRTGESFLVTDARELAEANPQGPYRGALSIPVGDHGVFQTVSEEPGAFDEDDLELAELLVSHTARALDQLANERELRRQNERLDEFARVVSHDLRNPLNVAEGRLELALDECDSEHLEDVARAHDRMARLIDDLLTVAREGKTTTQTGPVDLEETVETCWQNVETARATLVADTNGKIHADDGRLKQLLENLFRNAVEHSSTSPDSQARQDAVEHSSTSPPSPHEGAQEDAVEHGGKNVTISVGELDRGFFVEDDGPGVPPEQREDVLELGYSTIQGGTGFGLSIVQRIADAHEWDVTVTEGSAGGARIEITGVEWIDE